MKTRSSRCWPQLGWTPILALVALLLIPRTSLRAAERPPNIVFVLADDLGYGDLGCYGQKLIQTPHLDRMAAEGMRFTQAYCGTSVCAPSRCALMTGRHIGHAAIRANREIQPEGQFPLPAGTVTVAQILKDAGYTTALVGKWGLGFWGSTGDPLANGFDHFFGYNCQRKAHDYYPAYLWRNGVKVELGGRKYSPDPMADEALDWVRRHKDRPFFLYFAATLPHAKFEVPDLGPYAGKPWPDVAKKYAAMVSRLDADVGRLLVLLKELDLDQRTIVFFTSDNGADNPARDFLKSNGDLRGTKRTMYEGGLRAPMLVRWPGHVPAGKTSDAPWAFYDFLPTAVELARAMLPAGLNIDGISVVPALLGGEMPARPYLYWELHEPHFMQAARFGDWKAVRPAAGASVEVYDLKTDWTESHNVAAAHADVAARADDILHAAHVDSPDWPIKASAGKPKARKAADKRNVVFILADDLGWSDTTLFGTTKFYETPNIERLAQRGMTFANAYAANPLCSPTRASIMTGLFPARTGITTPCCHEPEVRLKAEMVAKSQPFHHAHQVVSASRLKQEYYTLAEALHDAGYATGHFGKWHLGSEPYSPLQQGFDVDVPHYPGPGPAGTYVAPWRFSPALNFTGRPGEHIEDRMADEAIKFLRANKDKPFFLNYWTFSVHAPFDAKKDLTAKYRAKADSNDPQRCPIYGAMVQSLDENIGRLLDALDEMKLADNTIIVFFSDNGGNMYDRVEGIPPTSNAPLRGGKATLYEGGTREPCIVVWPGKVKPGSRSDALLSSVDWYPTLMDMSGVQPKQAVKFDGVSQTPALFGGGGPRETVFCYFPHYTPATGAIPATWIRRGDWKLIRFFCDNPDQSDRFELYNLKDDIGETANRATQRPELVKDLNGLIDGFLKDTGTIIPAKNLAFDPHAQMPPVGKQPAKRPAKKKQKTANLRQELERESDAETYTTQFSNHRKGTQEEPRLRHD